MMLEKDYDYDSEPGRDFTYDDHGNVIYGRGYIGAPRLPCRSLGLDAREFVKKYIEFDEQIRLDFLNEDKIIYSYELNLIKFILEDYEKDKNKEILIKRLDDVAKKYIPQRSYSYQLNHFLELYQILVIRSESFKKTENKLDQDTQSLNQYLESKISCQCVLNTFFFLMIIINFIVLKVYY